MDVNFNLPVEHIPFPSGYELVKITVSGLKGGHSGVEIHKGRANANKLMAHTLCAIKEALLIKEQEPDSPIYLAAYEGGDKRNAITKEATAFIAVPKKRTCDVIELADTCRRVFELEYKVHENEEQKRLEDKIEITVEVAPQTPPTAFQWHQKIPPAHS